MNIKQGFSSFAVSDLNKSKAFYSKILGISVSVDEDMGIMTLELPGGAKVTVYPKPNHKPAEFTVLNLMVDDIDAAVDELTNNGVEFEMYDGFGQDEKGIARSEDPKSGPSIAWFTDLDGNILSIMAGQ